MVDRVHLNADERDMLATVRGGLQAKVDQWVPARLALARSLQMADAPSLEEFPVQSQQSKGTELHSQQLTGEGAPDDLDLTDAFRALLSAYEGRNLFGDDEAFHASLQRHVRRGLRDLLAGWTRDTDFNLFLAQELLFDPGHSEDTESVLGDRDVADRALKVLGQLGIGANRLAVDEGPRLTRMTLELHALDDLDRLRRGLGKIAFALGLGQDAVSSSLAGGERQVWLFVPRPPSSWRTVTWPQLRPALKSDAARAMALPVCLGTDVLGAPMLIDLAEAPHLFVGGTTGSGKSMCLHTMLLSLFEGSSVTEFVLIDPKAVELSAYGRSPRVRGGVLTSPESSLVALEELVEEMGSRQERFQALGARNLAEANDRGAGLARIVAVIDELGDLLLSRREVELPLIRLAQKARSAGIHLVLATQRPEAATFPGMLRSNIPSRIALTVQKASESRIILDEPGAESLLMRGDMLVRFAGQPTKRAHGCRVNPGDILAAVGS